MSRLSLLFPDLLIVLTLLFPFDARGRIYTVFSGGKSDYVIVVSSQASESEKYAASELQSCLEEIGGVRLPIVDCGAGRKGERIIIGYNNDSKRLFEVKKELEADDESFSYKNKNGDIVIIGGKDRGTMYGVFSFLENELGYRWLATDCTVIPSRSEYKFSFLEHSESPAFSRRSILYNGGRNTIFRTHNRINDRIQTSPGKYTKQLGGSYVFMSPHTMEFLLPIEKYFIKHPEYFAMIDGKRVKEKTQPCFSNMEVFDICVNEMRKVMRKYPDYSIYEISTLDNQNQCECPQCIDAIGRLGSYTDLVLDFVNRAADALQSEFPTKKIEFLAHGKVHMPPCRVIPHDNVVVRFCNISTCHIHGLDSCKSDNSALRLTYLRRWKELTKELYLWEYASDFSWYHIPFPNFYALRDNLVTYQKYGIDGVFFEGNHYSNISEFRDLRIYVLTKLLWNPHCDLNKVLSDFMEGYYGEAGYYMRQYFDFIHSQINENEHLGTFASYIEPYYSDDLIAKAKVILNRAKAATKDEIILSRIDREELTIDFLKTIKKPKEAKKDGTFERMKRIMKREGISRVGSSAAEKIYQKRVSP